MLIEDSQLIRDTMRVLVTGSCGFIGKWLGQLFDSEGVEWAGLDLLPRIKGQGSIQHYQIDFSERVALAKALHEFKPTALVHLAARCDLNGKSIEDYEVNRGGVEGLCQAVCASPTIRRAIYTSTQLVCKVGHLPSSDTDYCPHTLYGESKVATEEVVRRLDGGGVKWCLCRPTTVWGPHMSAHYQNLLKHIKRGTYFHSGGGELHKSYSYAENIAFQYLKLLTAPEEQIHQEVFYMADYEPLSLRAYANALADEMGVKHPPTIPLPIAKLVALTGDFLNAHGVHFPYNSFRLKNIRTEYIFDMAKTKAVCGDLPKTFEQGVAETAQWFLEASKS